MAKFVDIKDKNNEGILPSNDIFVNLEGTGVAYNDYISIAKHICSKIHTYKTIVGKYQNSGYASFIAFTYQTSLDPNYAAVLIFSIDGNLRLIYCYNHNWNVKNFTNN